MDKVSSQRKESDVDPPMDKYENITKIELSSMMPSAMLDFSDSQSSKLGTIPTNNTVNTVGVNDSCDRNWVLQDNRSFRAPPVLPERGQREISPNLPSIIDVMSSIGEQVGGLEDKKASSYPHCMRESTPLWEIGHSSLTEKKSHHGALHRHEEPGIKTLENADPACVTSRPYKCTRADCNWAFVRLSDFRRHVRIHEKPLFQCPFRNVDPCCFRKGGTFNRLDVLKRHMKLVHLDRFQTLEGEQGRCRICGSHFKYLKHFFDHAENCATDAYKKLTDARPII